MFEMANIFITAEEVNVVVLLLHSSRIYEPKKLCPKC